MDYTDDQAVSASRLSLPPRRSRLLYGLLALLTIAVGLASRRFGSVLPTMLRKEPGDALWAMMVFFLFASALPRRSTIWLATVTLSFSTLIEFSQLYHAEWIVPCAATRSVT